MTTQNIPIMLLGHMGNGRVDDFMNITTPMQSTIPSFVVAARSGAGLCEFDVFSTKDGHPVVLNKNELLPEMFKNGSLLRPGVKISDLSQDEIKKLRYQDGSMIPTLESVLMSLHTPMLNYRVQNQSNHPMLKKPIVNIELKGDSVTENTLNIVEDFIANSQYNLDNFTFSAFDWDKLSLVRELNNDALINPTIATYQLFDTSHVQMPGHYVDPKYFYHPAALSNLANFIRSKGVHAIDVPTMDIRPELIECAVDLGVGFCSHPTGPRRIEDIQRFPQILQNLVSIAGQQPVHLKVDNIAVARNMLDLVGQGQIIKIQPDQVLSLMGCKQPAVA